MNYELEGKNKKLDRGKVYFAVIFASLVSCQIKCQRDDILRRAINVNRLL